eukprot:Gregarina_sp_Pseudo_9__2738@NODE_2981_length_794_cov_100_350993_g2722_i0_p1_GENE_NODE_2981_length_794_cov_100_350993_g2722_i0NODE_2981_length_794_cov_100_350993_g2722_i0_p1_ORF_typecomplete_len221_score25_07Proteasome/PF00227_26/1_3e22_NODE_2981_length_794_cov_100_350993_g2722_i065727
MPEATPADPSMALPTITGASIIAAKYAEGVMMATFTSLYGGQPILEIDRIHTLGDGTLVGASGNHADYQEALYTLNGQQQQDALWLRGLEKNAYEWRNMMQAQLYQQRNKIAPSWISMLFAGFKDDAPYLGLVDYYGTAIDGDFFCPGLGHYFSVPDLAKNWKPDMNEEECRQMLTRCLRLMVRNLKTVTHQVQFAKITRKERVIEAPTPIRPFWHDTFI